MMQISTDRHFESDRNLEQSGQNLPEDLHSRLNTTTPNTPLVEEPLRATHIGEGARETVEDKLIQIRNLLNNEGDTNWLPKEFCDRVEEVLAKSGSKFSVKLSSRENLLELTKELNERTEWLDSAIEEVGSAELPEAISRQDEHNEYNHKRDYNLREALSFSSTVSTSVGLFAGVYASSNIFHSGWAFLPVLAGTIFVANRITKLVYNELTEKAEDKLTKLEQSGDAQYQEPINDALLRIQEESDIRSFDSDIEKSVWVKEKQHELYKNLKLTRAEVVSLSLECQELLNDFELLGDSSLVLNNQKQILSILDQINQKVTDSLTVNINASELYEALEKIANGEKPADLTHDHALNTLIRRLHLLYTANPQNEHIKGKLIALIDETKARAEL
jgi:predicted house-cleaning noncanonical NTP pyrophosphatase (MazG superfamily)